MYFGSSARQGIKARQCWHSVVQISLNYVPSEVVKRTELVTVAEIFYTCIRKVSGSNLGTGTGYND